MQKKGAAWTFLDLGVKGDRISVKVVLLHS